MRESGKEDVLDAVGACLVTFLYGMAVVLAIILFILPKHQTLLLATILIFVGVFIFIAVLLQAWIETHEWKLKPPKVPKPKQPNLVVKYLKARKNRVCPIIEWA